MSLLKYFYLYLLTFPVFLLIDFVWLGLIAKKFYRNNLGHLLLDKFNLFPAMIFYLLFTLGIIVFAVMPGVEKTSVVRALVLGAFLGLVAYATYDLSNLATLKNWPLIIVFVDIIWGTVLGGTVATISYFISRLFI